MLVQAGGAAGTFVDIALFPLDTLKTRLQSAQGFLKTGGFTALYKGIFPVIVGSAPTGNTTDTQYVKFMIIHALLTHFTFQLHCFF